MAKLPPIQSLSACPHCGGDQFYVLYRVSGTVARHRLFGGDSGADNSTMWDRVNMTARKTAACSDCHKLVARWDEEQDDTAYA